MSRPSAVERAIAALRTGRAVRIEGPEPLAFVSIETATPELLELVDPEAKAPLLISGRRATALSLANERDAADPALPALLAREPWLDVAAAMTLADPAQDFSRGPIGPLRPLHLQSVEPAKAALALARAAGLLPALWLVETKETAASVELDDLRGEALRPDVTLLSRARLPMNDMPETQIFAFRGSDDGQDHVALLVGAFGGKPPLVRLHSECLTGDVFGSLKCDCGPQLKEALRLIGTAGGGVLLYLRQEGRGIGLANKLRAYALQDRGLDTVDANLRLGFSDDERDYAHAAAILRALGIEEVRLLTNNPNKVAALEAEGIKVAERVAHHMPSNPHNADYLAVKRAKSGHLS